MLPQSHRDRYQEFFTVLEMLKQTAAATNLTGAALQQMFEQVQQLFQQRILCLDNDDINSADASRLQSYLTEINKQMRLLGIDVMFLQAARQPATQEQRLVQLNSRIQTLIDYCKALLEY